jgi:hypothetical protein
MPKKREGVIAEGLLQLSRTGLDKTERFLFAQDLRNVSARWVGFEQVASVVLCACSATAADFAVLADAALAFNVALVTKLKVQSRLLQFVPCGFQAFVFDVSESVVFVEAAGSVVAVFCDAEIFSAYGAFAEEAIVVPVVES